MAKGFTLDDERLKENGSGNYWKELFERNLIYIIEHGFDYYLIGTFTSWFSGKSAF